MSAKAAKLPRGRHSLSRQEVAENQRRRIVDAAAATIAEEGYISLPVRQVLERAGVSRATFYEQFKDKHECVTAAYEDAFERVATAILAAAEESPDWPLGISAAADAALEFATEFPDQARLLAAMSVVGTQILSDRLDRLPELKPELVQLILIPYIGHEEAGRIALAA